MCCQIPEKMFFACVFLSCNLSALWIFKQDLQALVESQPVSKKCVECVSGYIKIHIQYCNFCTLGIASCLIPTETSRSWWSETFWMYVSWMEILSLCTSPPTHFTWGLVTLGPLVVILLATSLCLQIYPNLDYTARFLLVRQIKELKIAFITPLQVITNSALLSFQCPTVIKTVSHHFQFPKSDNIYFTQEYKKTTWQAVWEMCQWNKLNICIEVDKKNKKVFFFYLSVLFLTVIILYSLYFKDLSAVEGWSGKWMNYLNSILSSLVWY